MRFFMEVLDTFWSLKQFVFIYIYGLFRTNGSSNIEMQLEFFQCHALPISNISFSEKGQ